MFIDQHQHNKNISNSKLLQCFWIPAHVGIRENENVDLLAKSLTMKSFTNISKIPHSDLFEIFHKNAIINTNKIIQ